MLVLEMYTLIDVVVTEETCVSRLVASVNFSPTLVGHFYDMRTQCSSLVLDYDFFQEYLIRLTKTCIKSSQAGWRRFEESIQGYL